MKYLLKGSGRPRAELVQVLSEEPRQSGLARARVAEEGKVERDGDAPLLGHAALGVHLAVEQQRLVLHLRPASTGKRTPSTEGGMGGCLCEH